MESIFEVSEPNHSSIETEINFRESTAIEKAEPVIWLSLLTIRIDISRIFLLLFCEPNNFLPDFRFSFEIISGRFTPIAKDLIEILFTQKIRIGWID